MMLNTLITLGGESLTKESIQQLISVMQDWIPKDASIAIAFDNCYLHYISGMHDIRIEKGQTVEKGSIAEKVFRKQCKVEGLVDHTIVGIPYYGIGYPIKIDEELGVLVVILPPTYHFLKRQSLSFLTGKTEHSWHPVPIDRVSHIESMQKKTWFYSEDDAYHSIFSLKNLTYQLPESFIRIHRSYIVNISYIAEITRGISSSIELTLRNGAVLPVSQTYSNEVRTKLGF